MESNKPLKSNCQQNNDNDDIINKLTKLNIQFKKDNKSMIDSSKTNSPRDQSIDGSSTNLSDRQLSDHNQSNYHQSSDHSDHSNLFKSGSNNLNQERLNININYDDDVLRIIIGMSGLVYSKYILYPIIIYILYPIILYPIILYPIIYIISHNIYYIP